MREFVVVTGTDTGVGKTVATAMLAVLLEPAAVVKPTQTGTGPGEHGDADEVARLSGVSEVHELLRFGAPLAPTTAARIEDRILPDVDQLAAEVAAVGGDRVIVEGAGGVLVPLDMEGRTLLDLAVAVQAYGQVRVVVVVRAGLGTLNHTRLTLQAIRAAGLDTWGTVIGAWPDEPGLPELHNRDDLQRYTGVPVLAVIPEGAGSLDCADFRRVVPIWWTGDPVSPGRG